MDAPGLPREDFDRAIAPSPGPGAGVGGRAKCRPEDFLVEELCAYAPDGEEGRHLLLPLTKRGLTTPEALEELARQLGVGRRDIGVAGRKDKDAVTTQWVSVPWAARERLGQFEHEAIELGSATPHHNKLRTGHLAANRFDVVLRGLAVDPAAAVAAAGEQLERWAREGLPNHYDAQRFGARGATLRAGLVAAARERPRRRELFAISALQAALFNLYLDERRDRRDLREALAGDILQRVGSGGQFCCEDPAADTPRVAAGELVVTGPILGSRTRQGPPGSPAQALEEAIAARAGLTPARREAWGKAVPGSRRPLLVRPRAVSAEVAPPTAQLPAGLRLRFTLPPGSYATLVLAGIAGGGES